MPQGSTVQQFWPECNVYVLATKLVDSIYRGRGNKWEILFIGFNGVFALRLLIAHIMVQERNGKILKLNKNLG